MCGVSGEESIGFFTPAAGQLPWQQGQRVPTATADADAEGEGLGPLVQASSQCTVFTFAILLHPGFLAAQAGPGGTSCQPLGIALPRYNPDHWFYVFPAFPVLSATAVAFLSQTPSPLPPPRHVVSELVKRCSL